jgi:hypothetical protein
VVEGRPASTRVFSGEPRTLTDATPPGTFSVDGGSAIERSLFFGVF